MSESSSLSAVLLCVLLLAGVAPCAVLAEAQGGLNAHEPALRDPTRPPDLRPARAPASKADSRLRLSSTLVSGERRTAIINGRIVAVGDRIQGARLLSIEPGRVRLRRQGREITLRLLAQNVKKPSRNESGKP